MGVEGGQSEVWWVLHVDHDVRYRARTTFARSIEMHSRLGSRPLVVGWLGKVLVHRRLRGRRHMAEKRKQKQKRRKKCEKECSAEGKFKP